MLPDVGCRLSCLYLSYCFMTGLCGFISFECVALRSFVNTSGSEPWIPGCSTSVRRRSLAHLSSLLHTRHRGSDLEGMNITLRLIPAFRPLQVGGEVSHAWRCDGFLELSPLCFGGSVSPGASDLLERLSKNFCGRDV